MRYRNLLSKVNFMLLSLALSEFMTGAVNIPSMVHAERVNAKHITESITFLLTADIITIMCAAITMMTLCGIIIDRYLMICSPFKYMSIVTKRKIIMFIIASWTLPLIVSFLRLAWLAPLLSVKPTHIKNFTLYNEKRKTALRYDRIFYIVGSSTYLLVVITLVTLFVLMFRSIRRLGKDEREFTTEKRDKEMLKRETKAVVLFAVMFFAFILCWTPLVIFRLLASVFPKIFIQIPMRAVHALIIIKYLTSILNPCLYILYKYEFYQEFTKDRKLIKKLCCCQKRQRHQRDLLTEVSFVSHQHQNGQSNSHWLDSKHGQGLLSAAEV